ncbi:MAG: divalent metal cation transporter [Bacteroidetes bacterium]|nr:MAG: divalent metal cation transporter [Bacteroidota bacterium]
MKRFFGPSTLVAAAFIGPGTVTICTLAGVQTGYELLWAMLFATLATIVLQEMAARMGFVTRQGLGEALNTHFSRGIARYVVFFLVIGAILIGNAAYEAGNISGGVLGIDLIVGEYKLWPLVIGGLCFALMYWGTYKWIERILIGLVLLMSLCFLLTAVMVRPGLGELLRGFVPGQLSGDHFLLALGLIGTTVVPYNLFLHAATISKKWGKDASLKDVRIENSVSILLGGFISSLIIITAAGSASAVGEVSTARDLAVQLQPLFGQSANWLMGAGLMAAGVSSALTAPLAAAFAARGLFGWPDEETHPKFRAVWMLILLIGVLVAITDVERVLIIKFAQVTNALLLPFVAAYLLFMANSRKVMGRYTNGWLSNGLGTLVILITLLLAGRTLWLMA